MTAKTVKTPILKDGTFTVKSVDDFNFFDLLGEKSKTKGSSNKCYHIELHIPNSGNKYQIHTSYGATGGSQIKEWREYSSLEEAEKDYNAIIKSKIKKGYVKIDIAQRVIGTDAAKQIVKPVVLNVNQTNDSSLPTETQNLIRTLFGDTSKWVSETLKCPLGQLTNNQIDEGRKRLDEAKDILNNNKNQSRLQDLTNEFYALIPHNLGSGSRGQLTHLLFDDLAKISAKEQDLDTLLDAKSVASAFDNSIQAQYNELQCDFDLINPNDDIYKFINLYFEKSKIKQHGFGSTRIVNMWKMKRKGNEREWFLSNSEKIADKCGKNVFQNEASVHNASLFINEKRPDLDSSSIELFNKANTWLCWHGTRNANVIGISKKGLLIRPAGAVITGAMYGGGTYFAVNSTKSLNYCDNGYWTGNNSSNKSKFMFLLDVSLGNMYKAPRPFYYTKPPKGYHSVYGKAGGNVKNDEVITYNTGKETQSTIKYLLEIN